MSLSDPKQPSILISFHQRSPRLDRGVHHGSARLVIGVLAGDGSHGLATLAVGSVRGGAAVLSPSPGCGRGVGVRATEFARMRFRYVKVPPVPSSPALLGAIVYDCLSLEARIREKGARVGISRRPIPQLFPSQSPPFKTGLYSLLSTLGEGLVWNGWIGGKSGGRVAWLGGAVPLAR